MSLSESTQSFQVRGKGSSNMRLPLHRAEDLNGNTFSLSSSSPSSSSSASPESHRSVSSLSGSQTHSPVDYDMLEITLTTTVVTKTTDVVVFQCGDHEEASVEKLEANKDLSESNDNSVSIYLDASSGEYCQDTWTDKENLDLDLTGICCSQDEYEDVSSGSERKNLSSNQDSDVTEVPAEDDDDDEEAEELEEEEGNEDEALFQSVSSEPSVQRNNTRCQSNRLEAGTPEDLKEDTHLLSHDLTHPPEEDCKKLTSEEEGGEHTEVFKPGRSDIHQSDRAVRSKPSSASASASAQSRFSAAGSSPSVRVRRLPGPDLRHVKAKVDSRPTLSPAKASTQVLYSY